MGKTASVDEPDITAIQLYLGRRSKKYELALNRIKSRFEEYWHYDPVGRAALYRVASRGDYQFGQELKTVQSIYTKIKERRKAGLSSYSIDDVEDIIGLRLVCVYHSDAELALSFLRTLRREGFFGSFRAKRQTEPTGYKAYHVNVALSAADLRDYKCEIQIVTMLEETWSYKTHDLIYKPSESITVDQRQHAKTLSDILHACDAQSELLRRQITGRAEEENQRRDLARVAIMDVMTKLDPKKERQLCLIRDQIVEDRDNLRRSDARSILARLERYVRHHGINIEVCKVVMLLAVLRECNDLDQFAVDHIEKLIRHVQGDDSELLLAYRLAGLSYYCLGMPRSAIFSTEEALKLSVKLANQQATSQLKSNIAYFIADSNMQEQKELARRYSKEAHDEQPDDLEIVDTWGYVKIVFGETYEEVEEGLQHCREVFNGDTNRELAGPYYELHRKRAYLRLAELKPTDPSAKP